jgi:predicted deacylase
MDVRSEPLLRLELPYRDTLDIQRTVFDGGPGLAVAVISGIHGDEVEGLYLCHRLAQWLEQNPGVLKGRVELYPAANPLGLVNLQRTVPLYESDLNRNFPGHADGLVPQRMADALFRGLRGASLVIDVHASNIFLREIPQVRINQSFAEKLVPIAREMNLDLIWVHGALTVMEATVSHSLNSIGIPCLVVEMGVGMRITPEYTEQLVTGLLQVWRKMGVIAEDAPIPEITHRPALAEENNVHYLNAATSGLFIPRVEHWTSVQKDDRLGSIVSPLRGTVLSEIRSPVDGLLFTLREYPLVYEGSLIARIMETS